jgi:hypothetical protein
VPGEDRAPPGVGDVRQRQAMTLPLDAHSDEPDAGPGIEPAVQEPQLGRPGLELQESERGARVATRLLGTLKLDPDLAVYIQQTQVLVPTVLHDRDPPIPTAILTPPRNSVHDSEHAV